MAAHGSRVVRLGSASKVLAPALRVGWLSGPAPVGVAVERLTQCADLCGSALTQAITAELLADRPWLDSHLRLVRAAHAGRAAAFTDAVAEDLPAAICSVPTGGMFSWLEFPAGSTRPRCCRGRWSSGSGSCPVPRSPSTGRRPPPPGAASPPTRARSCGRRCGGWPAR